MLFTLPPDSDALSYPCPVGVFVADGGVTITVKKFNFVIKILYSCKLCQFMQISSILFLTFQPKSLPYLFCCLRAHSYIIMFYGRGVTDRRSAAVEEWVMYTALVCQEETTQCGLSTTEVITMKPFAVSRNFAFCKNKSWKDAVNTCWLFSVM